MHNFIIQLIFHVRFLFLANGKKKVESILMLTISFREKH